MMGKRNINQKAFGTADCGKIQLAKAAVEFAPEIRLDRVKEIEEAILENRYRIYWEEIAEKMICIFHWLSAGTVKTL
jgi:anti-sigma28 factor (negative regulator of flagellin synthesis)